MRSGLQGQNVVCTNELKKTNFRGTNKIKLMESVDQLSLSMYQQKWTSRAPCNLLFMNISKCFIVIFTFQNVLFLFLHMLF